MIENLRITVHAYVRVSDNNHMPIAFINFLLHSIQVLLGEPHRIKFKVFEFVGVTNIQPERVYWNFVLCKITIPLHDLRC
jgi:hypothetical protein